METLVLSLFLFAFLAVSASGANQWAKPKNSHIPDNLKYTMLKNKLAGDDEYSAKVLGEEGNVDEPAGVHFAVGSESKSGMVLPGPAVGVEMGQTTYDYQHNSRMTRMVAWRGDHTLHFDWMKKNNDVTGPGTYRMTAYQAWIQPSGAFGWSTSSFFGGKDLHVPSERSGYAGIDVLPVPFGPGEKGRAVPYNHYDLTGGSSGELNYLPTIWPDFAPAAGNFGTYKQDVPDELLVGSTTGEFIWPDACTQITTTGDTVVHIVTRESDDNAEFSPIRYFRRVGPVDPVQGTWTGFTIDTIATISYIVEPAPTSAPNPNKVAIVWAAHWPATPGGPNSTTPGALSLLVEQNQNDVYCMISDDAGVSWGATHNISQTDSTVGGFVILGDMSGVIDTDGRLHVVWAARPTGPLSPGATGASALDWEWPRFPFSSRVLHWSDQYLGDANEKDFITVVKDGTWDWITEDDPTDDTICWGGAWHSMALNNPSISQCDDKLYVVFSQFQDLDNGVWDNCHERNFTTGEYDGSANGLLFFSVATMSNGGLNWDPSRPLTGLTQRCDTLGGSNQCHSHFWHSTARYGMQNSGSDNFTAATVVQDPSWVYNSTDYYLDVTYVDDHNPGGVIQGEGGWTVNPFRWFRVPCVDPIDQPVLAIDPLGVFTPSWNKPGTPITYNVTLFNIGNAPLTVDGATVNEIDGPTSGWLAVNSVPSTITEVVPNNFDVVDVVINNGGVINSGLAPAILRGNVDFTWESTRHTVFPVDFIVADTVQIPQVDTLFTNSISLSMNNAGGLGVGIFDTTGQMDFNTSIECDNCYNGPNNLSERYLYDASPFVMKVTNTDTLVSAYAQSHSWLSEHPVNEKRDGFRPINTLNDMGTNSVYNNVVSSNIFYNADSTVALEQVVYAPKNAGNNGNFMGIGLKVYNVSGAPIDTLYVGHIEDWDVPSDSLVRNGSLYDNSRQLIYMYGWETATADTFCSGQNDCADADKRYGGSAFVGQFAFSGVDSSISYNPFQQCVFSWKNSTYTYGGHIGYDSLYQQRLSAGCFGGATYSSTDPDSTFMDLMDIAIYGSYTLGVEDTLYFMKTMVSEYQDAGAAPNPVDFLNDVDNAVANLKGKAGYCCRVWGLSGDADANGTVNLLDILYAIDFKFKNGDDVKWPDLNGDLGEPFSCSSILDVNADGNVNLLDILYLIDFKFKQGPAPSCPI